MGYSMATRADMKYSNPVFRSKKNIDLLDVYKKEYPDTFMGAMKLMGKTALQILKGGSPKIDPAFKKNKRR